MGEWADRASQILNEATQEHQLTCSGEGSGSGSPPKKNRRHAQTSVETYVCGCVHPPVSMFMGSPSWPEPKNGTEKATSDREDTYKCRGCMPHVSYTEFGIAIHRGTLI